MRLNYQVDGNGTPVLFLHGFLESSTMWNGLSLPVGIQAIKVDLSGHGQSNKAEQLCDTIDEMAQMVSDIIDDLGVDQIDVIGHSMGGYVALSLKKNDARCRNVLLLNSNFWDDSESKKIERHRIAELVETSLSPFIYVVIPNLFLDPGKHDAEVKMLIKEGLEMTPEAIAKTSIAMSNRANQVDLLKKNPDSFTIIQGGQDTVVNRDEMKSRLTGVDVKLIELVEVGHMAHIELTTEVERLIASFLSTT